MTLKAHFDASDNGNVFEAAGNPPTDQCEDADGIFQWQSESSLDFALVPAAGQEPTWDQDAINGIGAAVFTTANSDAFSIRDSDGTTSIAITSLWGASDLTIIAAFVVTATPSNAGTIYNEGCVFADNEGYVGMHLRNDGGSQPQVVAYIYDGGTKIATIDIALSTTYVVRMRRESGANTLYISVNGGSETSVASGMPAGGGTPRIAASSGQSSSPITLGEIAFFDTGSAASTASELAAMLSKWGISGAASVVPVLHQQMAAEWKLPVKDTALAATLLATSKVKTRREALAVLAAYGLLLTGSSRE